MKVNIIVNSPAGMTALLSNPINISIIFAGIIGIIYLIYHFRKKRDA